MGELLERVSPVRPKRGRALLWGLVAVLLSCGLVDWWLDRRREHRYDSQIVEAARRYGVSPGLVKGVVWRESRFHPRVRGRAGEIGLMQIRSLAAQEWATAEKRRSWVGAPNLFDPETNLQVGSWYLGKLLRRYAGTDNPAAYALADYNAGRTHVLRWNKGAGATNSEVFLSQVTFPGTQRYVRAILEKAGEFEPGLADGTGGR